MARSDVGMMTFCGVAGNEDGDSAATDERIGKLAASMAFSLDNRIRMPQSFWGVGGTKVFRDLIYTMRGLMKADHKFYKKHGIYDFPQKKRGLILKMQLIGLLMRSKTVRRRAGGKIKEAMIAPYQKVIHKEQ